MCSADSMIGQRLFQANCGDTRAVLVRNGKAERLSLDHKPSDPSERQRIMDLGGFVEDGRILGSLAVARAFGDSFLRPFVTAEPYIRMVKLLPTDTKLIFACDGCLDVMQDQSAVGIIANVNDDEEAATKIRIQAYFLGSKDSISVILVD